MCGDTLNHDENAELNIVQGALNLLDASQLTTDALYYSTLALGHERPVGESPPFPTIRSASLWLEGGEDVNQSTIGKRFGGTRPAFEKLMRVSPVANIRDTQYYDRGEGSTLSFKSASRPGSRQR